MMSTRERSSCWSASAASGTVVKIDTCQRRNFSSIRRFIYTIIYLSLSLSLSLSCTVQSDISLPLSLLLSRSRSHSRARARSLSLARSL